MTESHDPTETRYAPERRAELAERLEAVRARIDAAAAEAGRVDSPDLIVVTKRFPASDACALADLGVRLMGENRDQEAAPKARAVAEALPEAMRPSWHFIGQLQSNKAKSAVRYADAVHSVDRASLAPALDKAMARALEAGERQGLLPVLPCLIQVSLDPDAESGRGGVQPERLGEVAEALEAADHLELRGLMAVAPLGADPVEAFGRLSEIRGSLVSECPRATWLSAGMSQDLEAAVAAGATHVRIGSDVLGPRAAVG
ncbi:YggS family pyridoxal phosphate-dependent enzyme [Arthrobacter sp. UM1]|uniref:YggS family pyridoxal phosphate-dependent enzyme n=1 Tax=Arthrobacter sp. UM1 TaxID=2766776 RepID=UPI001CF6962F|nr:YggS family pyridoxal phosphate-dependent enzyme [Arthrobacter sp. UM1]MCB4207697.1 YggS family pyridoxal phosphate-dependent enzyme [Arthrobacter sp. UM1]